MNWNNVRTLRWMLAGFGLVAGTFLLMVGQDLVGGIIVVIAGMRIVMLLMTERRVAGYRGTAASASRWANGLPAGGGRVGGRRDELLQRLARQELDVAATAIGITPEALRQAVDDGRTISAVAADAAISSRQIIAVVLEDATARVDRGVAAGTVAAGRGEVLRSQLPIWAERFVLSTPGLLPSGQPHA